MTITQKLATFITETKFESMPFEVVTLTKRAMIDTLGVALAGSVHPAGKAITAFVGRFGCKPAAGIIGSNIKTSSPLAALANGTIAHVLDYDDCRADTQGHPSAVLIPVVLSLGEEFKASGKEIIEAYVLGIEIWAKISSVMPDLHLKGWHPSGILGTMGAAASAAKLLKLTTEQVTTTLGIAGSEAAGLIRNVGTMTKSLHIGNAAENGIIAALLAKEGFTAAKNILEGDANFLETFYGRDNNSCISKVVDNLGAPFALISPGLAIKKYPSCYSTHRLVDAMLHLISLYHIKPEEIATINCQSNPIAQKTLPYTNPSTALEAKFSIQFAIAVALTDQEFGLAQATDEKVNDPMIKNLMRRITLSVYPDWKEGKDTIENRADMITVRLKNRTKYSYEVLVAKGNSKNPLTDEELLAKYQECAKLALKHDEIERCIQLVLELEKLETVKGLMQIVARHRLLVL